MLMAITRGVSPALERCELSYLSREPIDVPLARKQHRAYERLLEQLGAQVISLPAEADLPDSMFVEDPALVLDEIAVIFPLGTASRRGEAEGIAQALAQYRPLAWVESPGAVEGGDILRIARKLYAGRTRRTNDEGIRQLAEAVRPFGYEVIPVTVTGCLHLKSAVTHAGGNTLVGNRRWLAADPFAGYQFIDVTEREAPAANVLALSGKVVVPASFPKTRERIERAGFEVISLDISELQKAEAGLTCSSLLFECAN